MSRGAGSQHRDRRHNSRSMTWARILVRGQSPGGYCQWVLNAACEAVEWPNQPLGFNSLALRTALDLMNSPLRSMCGKVASASQAAFNTLSNTRQKAPA